MTVFLCCLMLAAAPVQTNDESAEVQSVRQFVQGFYDWYRSKPASKLDGFGMEDALKTRVRDFGQPLLKDLLADLDAASKNPEEITGLDFDPFTDSQDPYDHYDVVKLEKKGAVYWVSLQGVTEKPEVDVIAVVGRKNDRWVFMNFRYPRNRSRDLLVLLKRLREDREKK
jgi:Protein of unknown function (DUF3828)